MKRWLKLAPLVLVPALFFGSLGYALASGTLPGGIRMPFLAAGEVSSRAEAAGHPEKRPATITMSTGERVVTLADAEPFRYVKTEIVLEFERDDAGEIGGGEEYQKAQEELHAELTPVLPALEDAITSELARRTAREIATPEGREKLKQDLLARFEQLHLERPIRNVYFTQFLIQ